MAFTKSDDPKDKTIQIRVTETERNEIKNRAFEAHEDVSSFILKACLSRPIRNQAARHEANELRLFIHKLKEIYSSDAADRDSRLTPVLEAAVACLNNMIGRSRNR